MELGIYTFGDRAQEGGRFISDGTAMERLIEMAEVADGAGLDVFGLGEHHRPEYVVSTPTVALAAIAGRTKNIRLTSAVTVLSSVDPVLAFQEFATLDLASGGRAELMAGRGSFIESFAVYGQGTEHYDELFAENLELLLQLRDHERVTWSGNFRAPLDGVLIRPRPVQEPLPVWVAVGGNPSSVVRAGALGLGLAIAIIGGDPSRMAPLAELYRRAAKEAGNDPSSLPVSVNQHGFIATDGKAAADAFWPGWARTMTQIGRERGWPPARREQLDYGVGPSGHLLIGDPETVAKKIAAEHAVFGHQRTLVQMDVGGVDHDQLLRSIELLGTEVAPIVRELTAGAQTPAATS